MNSIGFSALLESYDKDISELGQAYISNGNAVTFTSDFVPLIKLGSQVTITRLIGEKRMESFVGRVYLSSKQLMRIVEVDNTLIEKALVLFESNIISPGEFAIAPGSSISFNLQKAKGISGFLRYIGPETVRICTMEFVDKGQHLMFSVESDELTLNKMLVRVKERVLLMRNAAVLLCDVVSLSAANATAIKEYSAQLKKEESQDEKNLYMPGW